MSDTESFESVARSYDDCTWIGRDGVKRAIDRLKAAHEREMEEMRQMEYEDGLEDGKLTMDAVREMHDREIRDVSQREYHRGYVDAMHARATATWQLDQERMEAVRKLMEYDVDNDTYDTFARAIGVGQYECIRTRLIHLLGGDSNLSESPNPINKNAETESYLIESAEFNKLNDREKVVRKLQALQFGGGSHENLSKIAYAIYPCATGWTCESAAGLRDKLIELMGGVSKPNFADQAKDLVNTIIEEGNRKLLNDGKEMQDETEGKSGTADDSGIDSDCGYRGRDFHVDGVMYDVLGNERQKAVCKLRKCDGGYTLEWDNLYEIFDALGVDYVGMAMAEVYESLRDRLIHLLGGDQPSGIDELREMDGDGTSHNDDPTSSITDELYDFVNANWPTELDDARILRETAGTVPNALLAIASRMERRLAKAFISRGAELVCHKLHINQLEAERDELQEHCRNQQKQLAEFNRVMNTWHWDAENHKQWCPMSLDREVRKAEEKWESACERIGELKDECDDLKMRLREFADGQKRERKYYQQRIKKLVKERDAARRGLTLEVYRDAYDELEEQRDKLMRDVANMRKERDELQAKLDQYDATHIELPKDADGVSVRVGDRVRTKHDATYTVARITREDYKDTTTWYIEDFAANYSLGPEDLTHYKPADTAESIVRELRLGSITDAQAIERIDALRGAK